MHTDTTQKEKPAGSANYPAGHTDITSIPGPVTRIKAVFTGWASWLATVLQGVV